MARYILFRCSGLYGSVDYLVDELITAFSAEGDQICAIFAKRGDSPGALQRAIAIGADGFIGITGLGIDSRREGNLYNVLGWPFASIFLDPVVLYWHQIVTPVRRRILFTTAPDDVEYCAALPGAPAIRHLPHASPPVPARLRLPWQRRDIDILFAGTAPKDPAALRTGWRKLGVRVERRLNDILDAHDAAPFAPILPLVAKGAAPAARLDAPQTLYPYFSAIDTFLRARARWLTAQALLPLPVRFVGPGWDSIVSAAQVRTRAKAVGEVPAAALAPAFRRARLVVNTCTPYHGSHERVFDAMAGGAVALTTATTWLRSAAPAGSLVQFRAEAMDVAARAAELLRPGSEAEAIAASGTAWHAAANTWSHRVQEIKAGLADLQSTPRD
jgi:Glycosyl transferases group 1